MNRLSTILGCLFSGALLSLAALLVPYDFCMCGSARGLPLPVNFPDHGEESHWWSFEVGTLSSELTRTMDCGALLVNLLLLSIPALCLTAGYGYRNSFPKRSRLCLAAMGISMALIVCLSAFQLFL